MWWGGGCSVETPISRTRRPAEGHSKCFGVRKEEVWAQSGAVLTVTRLDLGLLTQQPHIFVLLFFFITACIFSVFSGLAQCWQKVAEDFVLKVKCSRRAAIVYCDHI